MSHLVRLGAVIAELVMQEVEEKALETSPIRAKWWRRYVNDSNACIKRAGVEVFYSHLNSMNANIRFTVEMPTTTMGKNSIAFLDTNNTVNEDGKVEVGVYRKTTHIYEQVFRLPFTQPSAKQESCR